MDDLEGFFNRHPVLELMADSFIASTVSVVTVAVIFGIKYLIEGW